MLALKKLSLRKQVITKKKEKKISAAMSKTNVPTLSSLNNTGAYKRQWDHYRKLRIISSTYGKVSGQFVPTGSLYIGQFVRL